MDNANGLPINYYGKYLDYRSSSLHTEIAVLKLIKYLVHNKNTIIRKGVH